jgi:hypothetical protein
MPVRGFITQSDWPEPYIQFQSSQFKLGNSTTPVEVIAESFGEVVKSLRTLLKREAFLINQYGTVFSSMDIYPFETAPALQTGSLAGPIVRQNTFSDLITLFSPLYAFSSGSVRLTLADTNYTGSVEWSLLGVINTPVNGFSTNVGNSHAINVTPAQLVRPSVEGFSSIEVPHYNPFGKRSVGNQILGPVSVIPTQPNYMHGGSTHIVRVNYYPQIDTATNPIRIYRGAADDFSLSVWNGVVPVLFSSVA